MTLTKTLEGNALTLAPEGRLDTLTTPELEKELETGLEGVSSLTLDCGKLEYISSAGLRALLTAYKAMGRGGFRLTHVNEVVKEVLDVTGFTGILTIE